jgi:hypothetical protein
MEKWKQTEAIGASPTGELERLLDELKDEES